MTEVLLVPEGWKLIWWGDDGTVRMPCPMPGCGCFTLYRRPGGTLDCTTCGATDLKTIQSAFDVANRRSRKAKTEAEKARAAAEADRAATIQQLTPKESSK